MAENQITPDQLKLLVQYASKKLNTTPQELASTLSSGGVDALSKRLSPSDAARLKKAAGGQGQLEELINSPQVQALLQSLNGKK